MHEVWCGCFPICFLQKVFFARTRLRRRTLNDQKIMVDNYFEEETTACGSRRESSSPPTRARGRVVEIHSCHYMEEEEEGIKRKHKR